MGERRFPTGLAALLVALLVLAWSSEALAGGRKARASSGPVTYRLSIPAPTTRYLRVEIEIPDAPAKETSLAMPAWAPGSYLIRDFCKHVYDVEARGLDGGGATLEVERTDKQTWVVKNGGRGFSLSYRVFADELSVRTNYVDDRFALLNGPASFMYVVGETGRAATLEVQPPQGWPVHTALDRAPVGNDHAEGVEEARGEGDTLRFVAPSYDELVDSPLLLGAAELRDFSVAGKPIQLVFLAPAGSNAEVDRLARDAQAVVRAFARTLSGLPFERYSFLMVADPAGGGGLEHHDSTAMIIPPWIFDEPSGYARAQRLMAHEFFHLWNVKRIHDRVLGPFDYQRENYSELLWFHEGFTETMETRALLRAGLISPADYLRGLAGAWTGYLREAGRNHTPIAELSREAWIHAYKPEANHSEVVVSYYRKGDLIGACLDLSLRLRSRAHGRSGSIEGLFRRLWASRDPDTQQAPIDIDDIVAAASAEAGEDMRWFFQRYVYGTEELPLPELLEQAGFVVESGKVGAGEGGDARDRVWSGMSGHATVDEIEPDSPAAIAGLMLGDEVIAVDGTRVDRIAEANERLADLGLGATATLSLFRGERLLSRELTTTENPHTLWRFARPPKDEEDLELARLRELWLLEHLL